MTVLLVRHAVALARRRWDGDDELRPLTESGRHQADAIPRQISTFAIDRVFSSPAVRCLDTVRPIARDRGLGIEEVDVLAEGTGTRGAGLVDLGSCVVLCGHGDNLLDLLVELARHVGDLPSDPPFAKGATWVLERRDGKVDAATYLGVPA